MNETLELLARATIMGVAGSAAIDIWSATIRRTFHVSTLDYRLLGRWIGHMREGRLRHQRIGAAAPVPGEAVIGWAAHYAVGIAFAALLLGFAGSDWTAHPTLLPPMLVGIGTVAAPWFVMQPAFGAGVAGSRTPKPWPGRLRNLGTHTVYGLGLYASALATSVL